MIRNHMPHKPLLRDETSLPYKALSPALSTLHSSRSRSPNLSSITKPLLLSSPQQQPTFLSIKNLPTNYSVVNHHLNSSGSSILLSTGTNHHYSLEAVPRTHSSNKRLRKEDLATTTTTKTTLNQQQAKNSKESLGIPLRDDLQSLFKKQRINGENINPNTNIPNINKTNSQVPSPLSTPKVIHNNDDFKNSCGDNNNIVVAPVVPVATVDDGPKKRGRKKDSKVLKNQLQQNVGVSIKEKIQSMLRVSKCKTTREIMEDLKAARALSTEISLGFTLSNAKIKNEPPKTKEILCDSSNDVEYNLSSQATTTRCLSLKLTKGDDDDEDNDNNNNKINNDGNGSKKNNSSSKNTTQFRHDPMVEKILAKLPPLDLNSINWSDNELDYHDDDDPLLPPTDEEIDRLSEYSIECLNGNFQLTFDLLNNKNIDNDLLNDKKIDKNGDGLTSCPTIKYPLFRKRNNKNNNSNNDDVGDDGDVDKFEFREWDQSLVRPTIDGQILHIKPYVIID